MEKFSQSFEVQLHQTNPFGKAQLYAVFQWFQEAAANHATDLDAGIEHLGSSSIIWVLSRLNLQVLKLPNWREEVDLVTWVPVINGISTERHFRITSKDTNEVLINGISLWYAIDRNTKRPLRLEEILKNAILIEERSYSKPIIKLLIPKETIAKELYRQEARASDIDIAGHVNNSIYVKWSLDALTHSEIKEFPFKEYRINFVSETFQNDIVSINRYETESSVVVEIKNEKGKTISIISFDF